MGVRGELFSNRVILPNRTYFFNVKENRMGDIYLNIVESKNRETGGFDRQSVILFSDDLQEFLKGFDETLRVMEKAVREKRRTGGSPRSKGPAGNFDRESSVERGERPGRYKKPERGERPGRDGKPMRSDRSRQSFTGEKPERSYKNRQNSNFEKPARSRKPSASDRGRPEGTRPKSGRRVVVKKDNWSSS
jgi:hypothetical protein